MVRRELAKPPANVEFKVGDACKLPFEDSSVEWCPAALASSRVASADSHPEAVLLTESCNISMILRSQFTRYACVALR